MIKDQFTKENVHFFNTWTQWTFFFFIWHSIINDVRLALP